MEKNALRQGSFRRGDTSATSRAERQVGRSRAKLVISLEARQGPHSCRPHATAGELKILGISILKCGCAVNKFNDTKGMWVLHDGVVHLDGQTRDVNDPSNHSGPCSFGDEVDSNTPVGYRKPNRKESKK